MADKALISELTWRSLKMQKDAFPDMPHFIAPDDLPSLLRASQRKEMLRIHVISLAVIADNEKNFLEIVRAIKKRKAKLLTKEEGFVWSGNEAHIIEEWKLARKRGAAKIGGQISADIRKNKSAEGIAKIKDRWPMPSKEWPTRVLLEEAGVSLNTAKSALGRRPIEQANYQAKLKRAAKRNAT